MDVLPYPELAVLLEIELLNRHIGALAKQFDGALRDDKAGRNGRNPAAIRAELLAIIQQKEKLVRTQHQALKNLQNYLTMEQAGVWIALLLYIVHRLGLTTAQWEQFVEDIRTVVDGPWRLSRLKKRKGVNDGKAGEQARRLYAELWMERHGTNAPPEMAPPDEDEPGFGETEGESRRTRITTTAEEKRHHELG